MADYRAKSYNDAQMQKQPHHGPTNLSSYSTCQHSSSHNYSMPSPSPSPSPQKLKKESKSWSLNDPEFQRKRRVASYKVYSVEGKLKGSVRKSVRWLKNRYTQMVYGWW